MQSHFKTAGNLICLNRIPSHQPNHKQTSGSALKPANEPAFQPAQGIKVISCWYLRWAPVIIENIPAGFCGRVTWTDHCAGLSLLEDRKTARGRMREDYHQMMLRCGAVELKPAEPLIAVDR